MSWVIREANDRRYWTGRKEMPWTYAPAMAKAFETQEAADREPLRWPNDIVLGAYVEEMPGGVRP